MLQGEEGVPRSPRSRIEQRFRHTACTIYIAADGSASTIFLVVFEAFQSPPSRPRHGLSGLCNATSATYWCRTIRRFNIFENSSWFRTPRYTWSAEDSRAFLFLGQFTTLQALGRETLPAARHRSFFPMIAIAYASSRGCRNKAQCRKNSRARIQIAPFAGQ